MTEACQDKYYSGILGSCEWAAGPLKRKKSGEKEKDREGTSREQRDDADIAVLRPERFEFGAL